MRQQTSRLFRPGGKRFMAVLLTCLWFGATTAVSSTAGGQKVKGEIQQQIQFQGRLLLGNLRKAREMGLRGDPWAMAYALQEAHRLVNQIDQAERLLYAKASLNNERADSQQSYTPSIAPLDERLDIDVPLSGGRWQQLTDLDEYAGFIPLQRVQVEIEQASRALKVQPPDLGSALLATNKALSDIHWQPGLDVVGWSQARDQLLRGYALAMDSHPGAHAWLVRVQRRLAEIPGGDVYARRLATLLRAPTLDLGALRFLARDLDHKVQILRNHAERVRLERATVELSP